MKVVVLGSGRGEGLHQSLCEEEGLGGKNRRHC